METFDVEELEESVKKILTAHSKNLSVSEFMVHLEMATERKLIPSHYGCMSASDRILLMSSKIKFMYINGDECGTFRINLCQQQQVGTIINAYALKLFSIVGPAFVPDLQKKILWILNLNFSTRKDLSMQRSTMSSKAKSYQVIIRK